jgi:hypothetical protein
VIAESTICFIDISGLLLQYSKDDIICSMILIQLFTFSSLLLFQRYENDSPFLFSNLQFLESTLSVFDGSVTKLKTTFDFGVNLLVQNMSEPKTSVEAAIKSESGFSTEVVLRNQSRTFLKTLFHSIEVLNVDKPSDEETITYPQQILDRYAFPYNIFIYLNLISL